MQIVAEAAAAQRHVPLQSLVQHFPQLGDVPVMQHCIAPAHTAHPHVLPPSALPPELIPPLLLLLDGPPEELLDPPEELLDPPLEEDEPPLEDDDAPLDDPLPDPPPLELELLVLAHSLAQCAAEQLTSLSPSVHAPPVQAQSLPHLIPLSPRRMHPT